MGGGTEIGGKIEDFEIDESNIGQWRRIYPKLIANILDEDDSKADIAMQNILTETSEE